MPSPLNRSIVVVDTQRTNVDDDKHNDFLKDQSSTHGDNDQKRETSAEHSDIDPRGNPAACIFVARYVMLLLLT